MILRYTQATDGDIPVIFSQAKNLIDTYEDVAAIDYDKVLAWVKRKIRTQIGEYCCVRAGETVCAYYRLCRDGELDDLYVLPQFQNQGIGSLIMERCIVQSVKPLYLYVFSRNTRAISFYQRFGFQIQEAVGDTRYIMRRNG